MPTLDHTNIGDVLSYVYVQATVSGVNGSEDTVDLTGMSECDDALAVPVYYHCTPDSALRDNGAISGGSAAFAVSDAVIVQCSIVDGRTYLPVRVIGFVDKPKSCQCWESFIGPDIDSKWPWGCYGANYGSSSYLSSIADSNGLLQEIDITAVPPPYGSNAYALCDLLFPTYTEGGTDWIDKDYTINVKFTDLERSIPQDINNLVRSYIFFQFDYLYTRVYLEATDDFVGQNLGALYPANYTAWTDGTLTGWKYTSYHNIRYFIDISSLEDQEVYCDLSVFPELATAWYTEYFVAYTYAASTTDIGSFSINWKHICIEANS